MLICNKFIVATGLINYSIYVYTSNERNSLYYMEIFLNYKKHINNNICVWVYTHHYYIKLN